MRILLLTPGTGSFHCGSCLRDADLARGLRALGHDAFMVPLYMPLVLDDEGDRPEHPIFLGGINIYLQHALPLFQGGPRWLDALLDRPALLQLAARFSDRSSPEQLGALTLAMLRGEEGSQRKEIARLSTWLREQEPPELVLLSNALLVGLAPALRSALGVPVLCTLQGEAPFLDAMPEPYRSQAWSLLAERAVAVDHFVAVSEWYGEHMGQRLGTPAERHSVVPNGIRIDDHEARHAEPERPTLGYLARLHPDKGLDRLVGAFIRLRTCELVPDLRLHIAGAMAPGDEAYVERQRQRLELAGLSGDVEIRPNLPRDEKLSFLRGLTLLSVPAHYGESFGLYILEALAAGVPVVQPSLAAFPELLAATGGGRLYDPDEDHGLATAIAAFLDDHEGREEAARIGGEVVRERFSDAAMARRLEAVIERCLKAAATSGELGGLFPAGT